MKAAWRRAAGLVAGIMALAALNAAAQEKDAAAANVGKPAPVLKVKEWVSGKGVTPADLKGKAYVLEFWATWCPPCRKSIPHLIDLAQQLMPLGVPIIGLSNEDAAKVRPFAEKYNMLYHVGVDGGTTGVEYTGIPFAVVVGKDGKIFWAGHPMDPQFEENVYAAATASHPDWKPLLALARANKLGAVHAALAKGATQAHQDGAAALEGFAARLMAAGEQEKGLGQLRLCKLVAERYAGLPVATQAAKKAAELQKDPAVAAQLADEEALAGMEKKITELRQGIMAKQTAGVAEAESEKLFLTGLRGVLASFVKEHPKHPQAADIQKGVEQIDALLAKAAAAPAPSPAAPAPAPKK